MVFMQGVSRGSGGLFGVAEIAPGLVESDSIYALLAEHRDVLFGDEMWADLFVAGRGRPSVPGPVIGVAMVLQALEGCSDREAYDRLRFDLRWKYAVGLGVDEVPFHFTVFTYWRSRIAASKDPDRLFRRVAQVVAESGAIAGKRMRAVDSTVLLDAVARQSTIQMLIWQIHTVRHLLPELADWIDTLPGGGWYADRLRPGIDWTDQGAKDGVVSVLVTDALRVCKRAVVVVEGMRVKAVGDEQALVVVEAIGDQVGLLALLAGQDVEPAPGSDGSDGRWRIARKVAPDRVISTVDTQARHVRKSRAAREDGYKGHIVLEPDTGLVTDACVTMGAGPASSCLCLIRKMSVFPALFAEFFGRFCRVATL